MNELVFAAIADPNRRSIMESLAAQGDGTATSLAADLDVSRQAAAKHLQLLHGAGLVVSRRVGRETRFEPQPAALAAITDWVTSVDTAWQRRGDAMRTALTRN